MPVAAGSRLKESCRNFGLGAFFGIAAARICGCAARSSAVAAPASTPRPARTMMFSQTVSSSNGELVSRAARW